MQCAKQVQSFHKVPRLECEGVFQSHYRKLQRDFVALPISCWYGKQLFVSKADLLKQTTFRFTINEREINKLCNE